MVEMGQVREIPIESLAVSRHQVRTRQVKRDLSELIENIRVHGQLEPILVCPNGEPDRYEIVAGQRRWLAMKELGCQHIRAAVLHEPVDEATARALSISENLVRQEVDSKDLIDACTSLYYKYGTVKAVAEEVGLPYHKVQSYVKFDRLRPQLKKHVESGTLDIRTALKVEDYCARRDADSEQVESVVRDIKDLTIAQRADYFRRSPRRGDGGPRTGDSPHLARPGTVQQILVTLSREDHGRLKAWAGRKQLTLDQAAAWILSRFIRSRPANEHGGQANR